MKFFRLDLLTLLISLFILNSCKNKDTIGLGLDSSTQLNGSLIDTSTIIVNTRPEVPVITTGLAKSPLGYFIDPVMGSLESNIAIGLGLPGTSYSLPTGTVTVDSAVLVLKYADGFYGDSLTSKYKVNVYQLGKRVLGTYYNTDSSFRTSIKPTLIGTRTFFARTHDSVRITNIITGQPDSFIRVAPQLRIPISKDFVNSILFQANSAQLASNTVFQNAVNGLYLTMDKTGMTGAGGTFMFSLADSLNVYYRTVTGTTVDTAMVGLPLGNHTVEIKHTFSTLLKTEIADSTTSRNLIYLQGLAGTRVRIKFPYLKNIIKTIGSNIAINRAELVITPNPGSIIPFKPQPKLTMYRYDIAHQPAELEDANTTSVPPDPRAQGVSVFGGFYSSGFKSYHFIITAYVQDLMNGLTVDYSTFLAPVDTTNTVSVDNLPTPQTAGRTVAVGSDKNSPYRIKLNIIYTKIK
jgi:hypothetical protein